MDCSRCGGSNVEPHKNCPRCGTADHIVRDANTRVKATQKQHDLVVAELTALKKENAELKKQLAEKK